MMKDYPLETVALISHPGCPGNKELPSAPLSVLMPQHALRPPASGLTVLALSPLLRSCFFPSEGQAQTALADFLNLGLLWVSSIHLMGSVSLGYLHKAGANELKETGLISELPPSPLPHTGLLVLLLLECSKLFLILLKYFF